MRLHYVRRVSYFFFLRIHFQSSIRSSSLQKWGGLCFCTPTNTDRRSSISSRRTFLFHLSVYNFRGARTRRSIVEVASQLSWWAFWASAPGNLCLAVVNGGIPRPCDGSWALAPTDTPLLLPYRSPASQSGGRGARGIVPYLVGWPLDQSQPP
jgi:hypothetical protein